MKKIIAFLLFVIVLSSCGNDRSAVKTETAEQARKRDSTKKAIYNAIKKADVTRVTNPDKKLLAKMTKEVDEFKGILFYTSKKYKKGYSNEIELYIVQTGRAYSMRAIFQYTAPDWLFMDSIELICDGKKRMITLSNVKRDNDGGDVYEYEDLLVDGNLKSILELIIYSKEVKMRYVGKDYIHDRVIKDSEKNKMKEVFEVLFKKE